MMLPAGLLALWCLLVGVLPAATIGALLDTAAQPVVGGPLPSYSLAIWHGLSLPLAMSALALGVGAAFYVSLQRIYRLHEHVHLPRGASDLFDALLAAVLAAARRTSGTVVDGRLQRYLVLALVATLVAVGWPLLARGELRPADGLGDLAPVLPPLALLLWVLGGLGALGTLVWHRHRFIATLFLGLTGLVVSLVFALLSAPDVALTQLLVEVATVLLAMLALQFLPASSPSGPGRLRDWRDAALAGSAGLGVAALAWAVLVRAPERRSRPGISRTRSRGPRARMSST